MMIYFGKVITMGFEPTIFWFVVRRLIRWATRPVLWGIKIRGTPEPGFMTTQKMTRQLYKWVHVSCDGRVVKALDLKSNGIFPRRFEPYSQRYFHHRFPVSCPTRTISIVSYLLSCDGRVVKAFDSKSNGIFPRRFESYSHRCLFLENYC